jgi:hypothetical protein
MKRALLLILGTFMASAVYAQKGKTEEAKLALSVKSFSFNASCMNYQLTESSSNFKAGSPTLFLVLNVRNNDKRDFVIKGLKGTVKIYGLDVAEVSENYNTEVKVGQIAELSLNTKNLKSAEDIVMRAMKGEMGEVVFEGEVLVEYGKGRRAKTLSQPVRASLRLGQSGCC